MRRPTLRVSLLVFAAFIIAAPLAAEEVECGTHHRMEQLATTAAALPAEGSAPFDPKDGRDPFNFAPDRHVDLTHLTMSLDFTRLLEKRLSGRATYDFVAFPGADRIILDAVDLALGDIALTVDGAPRPAPEFTYDGERIEIALDPPLAAGAKGALTLSWSAHDPESGLYFVLPDADYPGRPTQVWTQGQTNTNSFWFPTYDSPNERFTSAIDLTVPRGMMAVSNGRLVRREDPDRTGDEPGRTPRRSERFWYELDVNHPAYLVSFVVGDLVLVEDTSPGGVPLEHWVWKGQEENARLTFANTGPIVDFCADLTGAPYPFHKYAQIPVFHFTAGGMENISATTLHEDVLHDARALLDHDQDGLIMHEAAHQWFGDLITCRTWAHVWLNEGFATYLDYLWREHKYGEDWFYERLLKSLEDFGGGDWPGSSALVYYDYEVNWDTFSHKGRLPYPKGAWVLQMIRRAVGDDMFRRVMREYVARARETAAETNDLRRVLEELTGADWEWFFTQWTARPGTPRLTVSYAWDPVARRATVDLEQTQPLDRHSPAFRLPVEVFFGFKDGTSRVETIDMRERTARGEWTFGAPPVMVCPNPRASVAALITFEAAAGVLDNTMKHGPTLFARVIAMDSLVGKSATPAALESVYHILTSEEQPWQLRQRAAAALGGARDPDVGAVLAALIAKHYDGDIRESIATGTIEDMRTRKAVLDAAIGYRTPAMRAAFLAAARAVLADREPSYLCEGAVAAGVAEFDAEPSWEAVEALLARPSHGDEIRRAVIDHLPPLGSEEHLRRVMEVYRGAVRRGAPMRTRREAVGRYARFAAKLPDEAMRVEARRELMPLLRDDMPRVQSSAIGAAGDLGDPAALPFVQALMASRDPGQRRAALGAMTRMFSREEVPREVGALRTEVEKLRDANRRIEERLQELEEAAERRKDDAEDTRSGRRLGARRTP